MHALLRTQDLSEWACIYIQYTQILRKLETAYDQMVHPQKRLDMRKALEACIGRMLEIRHWMVKLNKVGGAVCVFGSDGGGSSKLCFVRGRKGT